MSNLNSLPKITLDYLHGPAIPQGGGPDGGRNNSLLKHACQFRDAGYVLEEAAAILEAAAVARDGMPPHEFISTMKSAYRRAPRQPIRHKYRGRHYDNPKGVHTVDTLPTRVQAMPPPGPSYDLADAPLPQPVHDGWRSFLQAAFQPEEPVCIVKAALGEDGSEYPPHAGDVLTCAEWLKRFSDGFLDRLNGGAKPRGLYVRVNPTKGGMDKDVQAFRHALLEFDGISKEQQWSLIQQSDIPCTAVIDSGNKSVHAWVRVNATDAKDYRERVRILYEHFSAYGLDEQNKNPSRFSRLPGGVRSTGRQELLAVNVGAKNFEDWAIHHQIDATLKAPLSIRALASFEAETDPNIVLGKRWLCRGGSALWVGQSGIGKSTLTMQAVITWSLGQPLFGIEPIGPLKSLVIQAENDAGDMAEMLQGVIQGMGFDLDDEEVLDQLERRVILVRDTVHTSQDFARAAHRLIDKHKPDLVWIDPLMAYIGGDINSQEVCSRFFRNMLNPISEGTGVIWMVVHHTAKPKDARNKNSMVGGDLAYLGAGSAEITNWARAVINIREIKEDCYELKLPKRGGRAGLVDKDGNPVTGGKPSIWLKHGGEKGDAKKLRMVWEYGEKPAPGKPRGKPPTVNSDDFATVVDVSKSPQDQLRPVCKKLRISERTFWRRWNDLTANNKGGTAKKD